MFHTLVIKQKYKGKLLRVYRLKSKQISVGTIKNANVKIMGAQAAGLACLIQKEGAAWKILDLGSEPDVKINHKPFTEHIIEGACSLTINENVLEIEPIGLYRELFNKESKVNQGRTYYIAKWNHEVIDSGFDKSTLSEYISGADSHIKVTEFKVSNPKTVQKEYISVPKEMRKPLGTTFGSIFIFLLLLIGIPQLKTPEPEKPKDNLYTKMIYDSKILKEKKKQLQSAGTMLLKGGGGEGQAVSQAKKQTAPESKVVTSLRQSGISSVIGRIAKQASKNAALVAKLAAMPSADASINAKELNNFGQTNTSIGQSGKSDMISGDKGFKVAGVGTAGKGGGTGGYKNGSELGNGGVGQGNISIDDTESIIEGGLDREVIAKIIREHLGQIRYCYDRQLASDSELHGKVKVKFSINADGQVDSQSVGESTMNNAMVEECILRRIATWKFPKPKGGTKVLVSYPFLFKSVN